MDPLDSDSDKGLTFTSPNWPNEEEGKVFRITNTNPPHPAGSFHYDHDLPPVAKVTLIKVSYTHIW